jgi:heme/copper-type cytochrome/quinol oxidase subunit 2
MKTNLLVYLGLLANSNTIFNDAPQPFQFGFQDSAAPGFTGLVTLHNTIGFYLIVILLAVTWVLFSIMYYYSSNKNPIAHNQSLFFIKFIKDSQFYLPFF